MRRFLLFPPLIAVWLVLAQVIIMTLSNVGTWITLRVAISKTDVYLVSPTNPWDILILFIPAFVVGLTIGCLFAAADASFHPTSSADESTQRLTRNLLKSGAVVSIMILLCQVPLLIVAIQYAHRRYHAYAPEITWLNWIALLQPFLVFTGLLWALRQTFTSNKQGDDNSPLSHRIESN